MGAFFGLKSAAPAPNKSSWTTVTLQLKQRIKARTWPSEYNYIPSSKSSPISGKQANRDKRKASTKSPSTSRRSSLHTGRTRRTLKIWTTATPDSTGRWLRRRSSCIRRTPKLRSLSSVYMRRRSVSRRTSRRYSIGRYWTWEKANSNSLEARNCRERLDK